MTCSPAFDSQHVSLGRQRGVALVVALVLLIVITLVGLAAVRGTIMQQKMTSNFYDREIAFQASEAALRQGEAAIREVNGAPAGFRDCSPTSGNVCQAHPFDNATITPTMVGAATFTGTLAQSQPQYIVEYMGDFAVPVPNVKQISSCSGYVPCSATNMAHFFRITARSGGANVTDRASVMLQSIYKY